jgi:hypothetical protein
MLEIIRFSTYFFSKMRFSLFKLNLVWSGVNMAIFFRQFVFVALLISSAWAANPPFVHNKSDVKVDIDGTGRISQVKWPINNGQNMLFPSHGLDLMIGYNNSVTNNYTLNSAKSDSNSFTEKSSQFTQRSIVNVSPSAGAKNFEVEQSVFTYSGQDGFKDQDSLIEIKYRIKNTTGSAISGVYFGSYFDLQPSFGGFQDEFGYVDSADMIYWKISATEYAGIRVVSEAAHSVHFKPYVGANNNQTYSLMSDGVKDNPAGLIGDYIAMVSVKAGSMNSGTTYTYTVALFFGKSIEEVTKISNISFARNGGLAGSGTNPAVRCFECDIILHPLLIE